LNQYQLVSVMETLKRKKCSKNFQDISTKVIGAVFDLRNQCWCY